MASLLCVKQPGGKVSVHSSDVVDELMIDSKDHIRTMKMNKSDVYRKRTRRPMSTSVIQSKVDSKSLIGQTLRVQDWLNEKTVKGLQFDIPQAWVEKQVYKCHFIAYCIALSLFSLVKCTCIYSFNYCRKEQSIYIYVMIIFHKEAHCMSLDRYMLLSFTLKSIS